MPKILVTGYDPFASVSWNVSGEVAKAMPKRAFGVDIVSEVIPTEYQRGRERLELLLEEHSPDVVIGFGVSGVSHRLKVERYGWNHATSTEDNAGYSPDGLLDPEGVVAEDCTIPAEDAIRWIDEARSRGESSITGFASEDAGSYLCNATMFYVGNYYRKRDKTPPGFVFVHLMGAEERRSEQLGVVNFRPWEEIYASCLSIVEGAARELTAPPEGYTSPVDIRPIKADPPRSYWRTSPSTKDFSYYLFEYFGGVLGAPSREEVLAWQSSSAPTPLGDSFELGRVVELEVEQDASFAPATYKEDPGAGRIIMNLWNDSGFYHTAAIQSKALPPSTFDLERTLFTISGLDTNGYFFSKSYELSWPSGSQGVGRFVELT